MISKIDITEFRDRLKLNTKYGNPKIKGTPFVMFTAYNEADKMFYGRHNDSSFQITKNTFLHPTPYIIVGKIKSNKKNETEIKYKIKPIGFGYYWLKYFPLVTLLIFNTIFFIKAESIEIIIMFNFILVFLSIFIYFKTKRKKNKMENEFKETFEIVMEK